MAHTLESERLLDVAIECTFPASDPIAVHGAFQAACESECEERREVVACAAHVIPPFARIVP